MQAGAFAVMLAGFVEVEYWASPTFFGGGAYGEFHQLLIQKLVLTTLALAAVYGFWAMRNTTRQMAVVGFGVPRT